MCGGGVWDERDGNCGGEGRDENDEDVIGSSEDLRVRSAETVF